MRMNPLVHTRMKAIANVRGVSLRQALEEAARKFYENLPEKQRTLVDQIIESREDEGS